MTPKQIGKVIICDQNHPHANEVGELSGKVISVLGNAMAEVNLDNCVHGTDSCFVSKGQIKLIASEKGKE